MPQPQDIIGRKQQQPRKQARPRATPALGKTPAQFRTDWGIARSTWDDWKRRGLAPAVTQPAGPGGRQIITAENEMEWARRHTVGAAAE